MDNNTGLNTFDVPITEGLHKSAIIYRDNSARFVYICFHCGRMFKEINETLQHIESHFQVTHVEVEQSSEDRKDDNLDDYLTIIPATETVDIKIEILGDTGLDEDDDSPMASSEPLVDDGVKVEFRCKVCNLIQPTKFLIRVHALNDHIKEPAKCRHCGIYYKRINDFKNHLRRHISKGEVSWESIVDGIYGTVDWSKFEAAQSMPVKDDEIKINPSPAKLTTAVKKREPTLSKTRNYTRPYRCHKCPTKCRYMNALRTHLNTHEDDLLEVHRCKECDCYQRNAFALRVHVLEVHRMAKRLSCNACALEFNCLQSKQFEEHLQLHNGPDNKLWPDVRDGINHVKEDFSQYEEMDSFTEQQHSCEFCTQRFYLKLNLDVHMKSVHSGQRRLQCGQCDSVFTTPKFYFAHQLEHQRVGPVITEQDDNVLLANLDACIDERIIYDENDLHEQSFRCLICNAAFDVQYDIRSHIRERHVYKMFPQPMEPRKEFICDLCGMSLKTKAAVKNHLLIHTNTKTHACTICGKKFRQNSDRRIHERQHTGEKPFQCHECGKSFISNGLLTAHKRSHDDTTYPCPICGRSFNLPSGYRKHIQTHRQDRSFKCTICTKSFNTRVYLTKHMAIHSDKQYQCRFCECKFNTSDGLRQHQRHKHKYASS